MWHMDDFLFEVLMKMVSEESGPLGTPWALWQVALFIPWKDFG